MDHEARQLDPVLIIGAARSGTKILRNVLTAHRALAGVPYDINYVWMIGHTGHQDDELCAADAKDAVRRFIRRYVQSFARPGQRVIEKTVGNALRVPFVDRVFPAATYIHLVRDGRDAAASARIDWQTPPSIKRIMPKLLTFPFRRAWKYGLDYGANYLFQQLKPSKTARSWGPRYRGMLDDVKHRDLLDVCALQWVRCVEGATTALERHAADRTMVVRYESLVRSPHAEVSRILAFIGLPMTPEIEGACGQITDAHIAKWTRQLTAEESRRVHAIQHDMLSHHGYL